jgi:hypothetical protein
MLVIQEYNYFKPYSDDTGLTLIDSMPYLTASIVTNPIQEIAFDLEPILIEPFDIYDEAINLVEKNDYRPLLGPDPTDEF